MPQGICLVLIDLVAVTCIIMACWAIKVLYASGGIPMRRVQGISYNRRMKRLEPTCRNRIDFDCLERVLEDTVPSPGAIAIIWFFVLFVTVWVGS